MTSLCLENVIERLLVYLVVGAKHLLSRICDGIQMYY